MKKEGVQFFFVLIVILFVSLIASRFQEKNASSITGFQTLGTPLTQAQIDETNDYITQINNKYGSYIDDIIEELDDNWAPHSDVVGAFWTKSKELMKLVGPCWALPNDLRPIDTSFLTTFFSEAEDAADTDGDTQWIIASHNLGDYNLNRVLDDYKARAKKKIALWCNLGQHSSLRAFCECNFNCAGGDNTNKIWNSLHYSCRDDCSTLSTTGLATNCALTCNTALCLCEILPVCTPSATGTGTTTTQPSGTTGGTLPPRGTGGGGTPPTFPCNAASNPSYNSQFPNTCINNCNSNTQICNKATCHCDPKPEKKRSTGS